MRTIWVIFHLVISIGILSIPIIIIGWFDENKWFVGNIMRLWAKWIIWSTGIKYDIIGKEYLNPNDQYIFMCNHESALDILIGINCLPYNIVFLAKKELFAIPFFGWALKAAGMIRIDRQNKEKAKISVDRAIEKLMSSHFSTLIYPEGTRSDADDILQFKKGGFILAIRSKLPVVPVTIIGAHSLLPKKSLRLVKGKVLFIIDKPINTSNLLETDKNQLLNQCRDIMLNNKKNYNHENISYNH